MCNPNMLFACAKHEQDFQVLDTPNSNQAAMMFAHEIVTWGREGLLIMKAISPPQGDSRLTTFVATSVFKSGTSKPQERHIYSAQDNEVWV